MRVFGRLTDWLRHGGGPRTQAAYRQPIIQLAGLWRRCLPHTHFIGITGSAGKTTTKEILYAVLREHHRCTCNSESNNTTYPIARTLLATSRSTRYCIQEVGLPHEGGMDLALALLRPDIGVVTNVGMDHRARAGGRAAVAEEKSKLIACLPTAGIAVLNADDDLVMAMAARTGARVVTYGLARPAHYSAEVCTHRWPDRLVLRVQHRGESVLVSTQLLGAHQAGNVLAALAAACELGVPLALAARTIGTVTPVLGRMSVHPAPRDVTFIRDDLKAPHWSIQYVWRFMADARASRKILVLGTMSDMHGRQATYRRESRQMLAAADLVLLVGARAGTSSREPRAVAGGRLLAFEHVRDAAHWLRAMHRPGDLVLLKGSNNADHLARLALALDQDVRCWVTRCGWEKFCDHCRLLTRPADPESSAPSGARAAVSEGALDDLR
jgi:UDP-N-acetylmuramyl pentapeptide synthase